VYLLALTLGPTAPRQLTWLIVGSNGVHLSWLPPAEPNGIITSFIISYCSEAAPQSDTTTAGACNTQHVHGESTLWLELCLLSIGQACSVDLWRVAEQKQCYCDSKNYSA